MVKTHLKLVKPATQKRAVGPLRRPNSELRSREHLTETEVAGSKSILMPPHYMSAG